MFRRYALVLPILALGCNQQARGPVTIPDTPDGTVQAVVDGMADQDPRVLWAALPPSYQRDVTSLIHQFATSVDGEVYDQSFQLVQKVTKILKDKKSFILNHPMASGMAGKADLSSNWNSIVGIFETIANSEFSSVSALQTFDMEKCLAGTGTEMFEHFMEISKASDEDFFGLLEKAHVELIKSEARSATVKVTAPGKPAEEFDLTKVEGRWLPTDLVEEWADGIAEARDGLTEMAENKGAMTMQAKMALGMVSAVVDQLDKADSQEEFNKILGGLMGGFAAPR